MTGTFRFSANSKKIRAFEFSQDVSVIFDALLIPRVVGNLLLVENNYTTAGLLGAVGEKALAKAFSEEARKQYGAEAFFFFV